jgi:hypothetical protein
MCRAGPYGEREVIRPRAGTREENPMHPWIVQNIAEQRLRDMQLEASRWRLARGLRASRRAARRASMLERTAWQPEPTLGEQAAWARGVRVRPVASS